MTGPYAQAAGDYWSAGWHGALPLPARRKANPPEGWTGRGPGDPSYPDVLAWSEGPEGEGNVGLRMPPGVIGLDVDDYGHKGGGQTLTSGELAWGLLPSTWRTTSRDDGVSGIRLYRVPPGLRWPGTFGPGTEIVCRTHRYAVAPPSVHPEGRTYRWVTPDGLTSTTGPAPDELPELPQAWLVGLTEGRLDEARPKAGVTDEQAEAFIAEHDHPGRCDALRAATDRVIAEVRGSGSAHAALDHVPGLLRMGAAGHRGLDDELERLWVAFHDEVTGERGGTRRDRREAAAEWDRSLVGAVSLVADDLEHVDDRDPCEPTRIERPERGPEPAQEPPNDPGEGEETGGVDADDEQAEDTPEPDEGPTPEQREELRLLAEVTEQRRRRDALRRLAAEDAPPLRWLTFAEFRSSPRPRPLVPGLLYRDSLARLFGAPGCGKSFLGVDLACHVALGRAWRGGQIEATPVVYVMAEGQAVNVLRVEAWCERNNVDPTDLDEHLYAVPDAVALTEEGVRELAARVAAVGAGLVILDTKNAMMIGEENSATDTATMRRALDALRKASGACVVLVDHTGHEGTRARGSSAATAAMDTELRVSKGDGSPPMITAEVTRDKAAEAGREWRWHLRMAGEAAALVPTEIEVGVDEREQRGEPAWKTAEGVAVATELLHYEGRGAAVMPSLARFLAHDASARHGDLEHVGVSRAEAARAMRAEGFEETGVRRAWSSLLAMGYLERAEGVKNDTGRHVWTV